MKRFMALAIMVCVLLLSGSGLIVAADDSDSIKWIAKCMEDNKDEGQPAEVVRKYCECMNSKMATDETQSITEWEKTHPQEQKTCSAKAGWK